MNRIRHTPEQIVRKLREADAMLAAGKTEARAAQHLGTSEQSFQRWRSQFGGMKSEEANEYLGDPQARRGGWGGGR